MRPPLGGAGQRPGGEGERSEPSCGPGPGPPVRAGSPGAPEETRKGTQPQPDPPPGAARDGPAGRPEIQLNKTIFCWAVYGPPNKIGCFVDVGSCGLTATGGPGAEPPPSPPKAGRGGGAAGASEASPFERAGCRGSGIRGGTTTPPLE